LAPAFRGFALVLSRDPTACCPRKIAAEPTALFMVMRWVKTRSTERLKTGALKSKGEGKPSARRVFRPTDRAPRFAPPPIRLNVIPLA
jgi:hypothetical protein